LDADESAELLLLCVAELLPLVTDPPLTMTGTLALTAFCLASAVELAV